MRKRLRELLCDKKVVLTAEDVTRIEQLEQRYYTKEFLYGSSAYADVIRKNRIEGCGELEIRFQLAGTLVHDIELAGDFFSLGDAQTAFRTAFVGLSFTPESLSLAITQHHPEKSIRGLSEEALADLIGK